MTFNLGYSSYDSSNLFHSTPKTKVSPPNHVSSLFFIVHLLTAYTGCTEYMLRTIKALFCVTSDHLISILYTKAHTTIVYLIKNSCNN